MFAHKTGVESGETCRGEFLNGDEDVFSCPQFSEPSEKKFCCGLRAYEKHCCEWNEYFDGLNLNLTDPENISILEELRELLLGGVVGIIVIIVILLVIAGLIIWCSVYACCLLSRRRQERGQVISM